jgi:uncharacterized membrane protein
MIATRKSKIVAAAIVGTVLLGGGTAAFASSSASTPAGGTVRIFVNVDTKSQTVMPIVITGAIGDYGTATSITKSGKVDANGNYVKIALKKGSFEVNSAALNAKANNAPGTFTGTTCSFSATVTGAVTLFNGSGLYKGISGAPKITENFGGVLPRLANGTCNANANPLAQGGSLTGVGKVKF